MAAALALALVIALPITVTEVSSVKVSVNSLMLELPSDDEVTVLTTATLKSAVRKARAVARATLAFRSFLSGGMPHVVRMIRQLPVPT